MDAIPLGNKKLKVVQLTTDAREHLREYEKSEPYFGTAPAALLDGFALLPQEVEVHVVSCTQRPMSSPEKLAPNIWFRSLLAPKLGWMRTGYQGCIRAVRRAVREIHPDIVHAQGTERDCAISGIFSGFPNVLTIHGNMRLVARINRAPPFSFQWLAARLERLTLPRSAGVICLTNYTRHAVSNVSKRTWVVPNAVDQSFFQVLPHAGPSRLILCVGHISPRKNQQQFIRALDPIAVKGSFNVLFLGGADRDDPYCAEFFNMIETRSWCQYGGMAERSQLKQFLTEAILLVLPSIEDNCPMTVLEAMAASVPVLAANVGGLPDLIQHEINGLFCDPTDLTSIRLGVERFLGDYKLRTEIATRAKQIALTHYHPSVIARRHLEIYREVLRSPS